MASKIYTQKGDKGKTALLGGTRVSKASLRIASYGTIDTLNSYVGWVADWQKEEEIIALLRKIQNSLFTIGSFLSVDPDKETRMKLPHLKPADITLLEENIDKMDREVPPLRSFILPGGHQAVSACHIARVHCREAERICVALEETEGELPDLVVPYLNRLSDYFFMLARYTAVLYGVEERLWQPRKKD